jgi:hypothetical protein
MTDEFSTYSWETDEGWIKVEKRLVFPVEYSKRRKERYLEKKKLKYYKQNINPDYDPSVKENKADPTKAPDNKADPTKESSTKEEAKEQPKKAEEKKEADNSSTSSNIANGTFVKLILKNATYNGLVGKVEKFIPSANRYSVRLHLPETQTGLYKSSIKVSASSMTPTSRMPVYGEMILHVLVLVFALLSFFSKRFYSYSLYATGLVSIVGLVYLKGKPSMKPEYAQGALSSPQAMNLMCAFALLMAKPYAFFLAPPLCRSVNRGFGMLASSMEKDSPSLYEKLKPMIDPVLARRANFRELSLSMEVYLGIGQLLGLVIGMSSFGSIFIYWNFLRMKYIFSLDIQRVFTGIKYSVDQKLYAYPSVKGYWQKLCDFAYSYVDMNQMRQQQQAGGGMMDRIKSMCTIM